MLRVIIENLGLFIATIDWSPSTCNPISFDKETITSCLEARHIFFHTILSTINNKKNSTWNDIQVSNIDQLIQPFQFILNLSKMQESELVLLYPSLVCMCNNVIDCLLPKNK